MSDKYKKIYIKIITPVLVLVLVAVGGIFARLMYLRNHECQDDMILNDEFISQSFESKNNTSLYN